MPFTEIKTNLIANSAVTQAKIDPAVELGGGAAVTTSATAPSSPTPSTGDLWYNTTTGKLSVYYNAGWVVTQLDQQGIGSRVVDVFTATASQTVFTTSAGYSVGYVDVYINGIKLLPADFTATNATTVTLGTGADVSDEVVIISWTLAPGVVSFVSDIFTGDGTQTVYTLSVTPSNENQTTVVIDGVSQIRNTYSVSGAALTFSEAPGNGAVIEVTTAKGSAFLTTSYNDLTDKPDLTGLGIKISNIQVTDSGGTVLDDTAVDIAGGYIKITGAGFLTGCQVLVNNVPATSTTFVSSTVVRAQVPATAAGTYIVYLVNPDGGVGIRVNGVTFSATPSWVTGSSLEGNFNTALSLQLSATGASTFALQLGSTLPTGLTLSSGGLISGTVTGLTQETVYSFTVIATDAENQDSPRTFSITITVGDQYFNRTVLAINGDVNTFVSDASTNNFPITVVGDTRPSNFSPYNTNWSNFFDGTGDYLSVASGSALAFGSSSDFTIEGWYYPTAYSASTNTILSTTTGDSASVTAINVNVSTNGEMSIVSIGASYSTGTATVPLNTWTHFVVTRVGGILKVFLNGVEKVSSANTSNYTSTGCLIGGRYADGNYYVTAASYISNIRITPGTGVTTVTVPSSPLTAISGTSILTCQSNRIRDNSTNAFTVTKNGDTKVSAFGPFAETDTTTGSGYFDGTGDYLSVASNAAFALGTGDFCIEGWYFVYTNKNYNIYFDFRNGSDGVTPHLYSFSTGNVDYYVNGAARITGSGSIKAGQWSHIAVIRSGTATKLFINGVQIGSTYTDTNNYAQGPIYIGRNNAGGTTYGATYYCADFRVVKGTTGGYGTPGSTITVPTTPLTAISNTSLLALQTRQPVNNHTFIDNSGNNLSITRNGNVSQGSFSPFSPAGWSNYFDTSTGGLTVSSNTALDMSTGDFTIEGWYYPNATDSEFNSAFYLGTINGSNALGLAVSNVSIRYRSAGSGDRIVVGSLNLTNSWNHIALVRSSGTTKIYLNGTAVGSPLSDSTSYSSSGNLVISRPDSASVRYVGYISNFRIVKGTAVYTSNFTPPTSSLTAIANTSLLTCQSNRFRDNSTNNFAITKNGDTKVVNFSPFAPTAAYSPVTHGGSAYFDGSGDYFSLADNASLTMGAFSFTIEGWFYPLNYTGSEKLIILHRPVTTARGIVFGFSQTTGTPFLLAGDTDNAAWNVSLTGSTAATLNAWNHVALTRNSSTWNIWLNGVSVASGTASFTLDDTSTLYLFANSDGTAMFPGYISNFRMIKGISLYNSTFTPTTTPFSNISNTVLSLPFNNAAIVDVSSRHVMETVGDARVVTSTKKFGTGSMYFDGSGDVISLLSSDMLTIGTGDFTVEAWINPGSQPGAYGTIVGAAAAGGMVLTLRGAGTSSGIGLNPYGSGDIFNYSYTFTQGTWVHIAVTRLGTSLRIFINGTQLSSTVTNSTNWGAITRIGAIDSGGSQNFLGYIDDLRITKGVARYTANFTPRTTTFLTR